MPEQHHSSVTELVRTLGQFHFLDAGQLHQLEDWQTRFADSGSLAQELLHRGWLSAYQVRELLAGQASGLVLGSYVLVERLGAGGMGEVYKARHTLMNRTVALKIIRKELLVHPHIVERFHREIRAIAQLDHPNIVRALDAAQVEGKHFVVMEFLEGLTLGRWVREHGPLALPQACHFMSQACRGLEHIRQQGLVHRDIKPSNLMVLPQSGQIKILDLGLVLLRAADTSQLDPETSLTQSGMQVGTWGYEAPEQALAPHGVDIRADIYGLGCTLYFSLMGQNPFSNLDQWRKMLHEPELALAPLENLPEETDPAFRAVLARMMAFRPEDRYRTPDEVHEALRPWTDPTEDSREQAAPTIAYTATAVVAAAPPRSRRRLVPLVLAGLLAVALAAWLIGRPGYDPSPSQPLPQGSSKAEKPPLPPGEVRSFVGHREWVSAVLFLPDGRHVLSGGADGLRYWDRETGQEVPHFKNSPQSVRCLALAPDGQTLLVGTQDREQYLSVWDLPSGTRKAVLAGATSPAVGVVFSPDGQLAVSHDGQEIALWDMVRQQRLRTFADPQLHARLETCWPADKSPLSGSWREQEINRVLVVQKWNPTTGQETGQVVGITRGVEALAFSRDGQWVLAADSNHSLVLFDATSGAEVRRFHGHQAPVQALALSPDGSRALSGGGESQENQPVDCTVRLWNIKTGQELHSFTGHTKPIRCVAFSADGKLAISADRDGSVRLWQLP